MKFGTDGVRGVALVELTTEFTAALGAAAARVIDGERWLIGRDPRESGPELEAALAGGLAAHGADVELVGVLPTPALAVLAAAEDAPAAMITASHNPYSDNGVKFFAAGGLKLPDEVEEQIEAALVDAVPGTRRGAVRTRGDAVDRYVEHIVGLFPSAALAGMSITVDCANGAMSDAAPRALEALGARTTVIHASPDGRNINAGCGATSPASLAAAVVANGDELGLALDGDGDRVIAADHLGRIVDGDHLLAIAARNMRERGELVDDTVVVTVMTNLGFRVAMRRDGIHVVETAVGDRYVLEALNAGGYTLGGEQSGHVILPRLATTGDGLLAGLRLAHDIRCGGRPLADVAAAAMTSYPQVLVNVKVAERRPFVADELAAEIAAAERAMAGEGRILVRASGTEPLIRVMVEARTADEAQAVADGLAKVVADRWS